MAPKQQQQGGKKGGGKVAAVKVDLNSLPKPDFWEHRIAIFDALYEEQVAKNKEISKPIMVTLPDGKKMEAIAFENTPIDIARKLSNSLPDKIYVARVNDELWDLTRPFECDCTLELLDWDDAEARKVFWHSSAHVLGYAMERVFQCRLSVGPALPDGGFFYEGDTNRAVSEADYKAIEAGMQELQKAKLPYKRLVISKEKALEMFNYSEFKSKILASKVADGGSCTVYKCGSMIDPCRGPHIPDTGRVKAVSVTKNSSSYFEGKAENAVLQRVYGIAFPKEALLKAWMELMEEAAKRDHRTIGRQQDLFQFHEMSPGSAFWLPHGARIYNALVEFQKKQYRKRGFDEVVSPNIYNSKLWMVSGHWQHYKDDMFRTECEHEEYALKPMNCPGHCVMFSMRPHSYKELPVRYADFGVLHRNELSGALTGLTRVRRFQQDDAHIFCRLDQVREEIELALGFLKDVYTILGFKFFLKLSTRPEKALGSVDIWNTAEDRLEQALNAFCEIPEQLEDPFKAGETFHFDGSAIAHKKMKALIRKNEKVEGDGVFHGPKHESWEIHPGDGAFYGPKIDIVVEDALKKKHQCATIQLDFNLPERFGLKYTLAGSAVTESTEKKDEEKVEKKPEQKHADPATTEAPAKDEGAKPATTEQPKKAPIDLVKNPELAMHIDRHLDPNQARPVMIHRAIFGSLERCIAILCEHYGGKWPLWLSPRQVTVVPVSQVYAEYAQSVRDTLHGEGYYADVDNTSASLEKKIRNAQLAQYNFILVVGQEEMDAKSVNVRTRDNQRHGSKSLDEMIEWLARLSRSYSQEF